MFVAAIDHQNPNITPRVFCGCKNFRKKAGKGYVRHTMSHESHGHSHRSGAATRYWREPKPIAITLFVFLVLLFISVSSAPTSSSLSKALAPRINEKSLPVGIEYVVWHDMHVAPQKQQPHAFFRHLEELDTSCEYRKRLNDTLYQNETPMLRYVACSTMECLWTVNLLLLIRNRGQPVHRNIELIIHNDLRTEATMRRIFVSNTQWKPLSTAWSEMFKSENYVAAALQPRLFERSSIADPTNDPLSCKLVYPYPEYFPSTEQVCTTQYVHREDMKLCFKKEHQCSMLTAKACAPIVASLQQGGTLQCGLDCWVRFQKEVHSNEVMHHTMVLCLITLFLLGCVLGLLFAKLYWVDPLLDTNERLQLESKSRV